MNLNYEEVPNILTCKDMDYLSDMFDWNMQIVKCTYTAKEQIKNEYIKQLFEEAQNKHQNILNNILSIIEGGQNE